MAIRGKDKDGNTKKRPISPLETCGRHDAPLRIVIDEPLHLHVHHHHDEPPVDIPTVVKSLRKLRRKLARSNNALQLALGIESRRFSLEYSMSTNPLDTAIEELIAEVAEDSTIKDSAITYIQGVPALIQAAIDAAVANGATPEQLAKITELKDKMSAKGDELKAALEPPAPPLQGRRK